MLFRCCPSAQLPGPLQYSSSHVPGVVKCGQVIGVRCGHLPGPLQYLPYHLLCVVGCGHLHSPGSQAYFNTHHLPSQVWSSVVKCGQMWSPPDHLPGRLLPPCIFGLFQSGVSEICSCFNVMQFNIVFVCFLKGEGSDMGHLDMKNQDMIALGILRLECFQST